MDVYEPPTGWLMSVRINSARTATLDDFIAEAHEWGFNPDQELRNNREKRNWLIWARGQAAEMYGKAKAKQEHRAMDVLEPIIEPHERELKPRRKPSAPSRTIKGAITAAQVNAWLATLPVPSD